MFRPMVQAHAREVLNRKDASSRQNGAYASDTLYRATERLMLALDRLEAALTRPRAPEAPPPEPENEERIRFFEQENQALRHERDELTTALGEIEREYTGLHRAAGTIYNKLEDSIKRLTQIMGD